MKFTVTVGTHENALGSLSQEPFNITILYGVVPWVFCGRLRMVQFQRRLTPRITTDLTPTALCLDDDCAVALNLLSASAVEAGLAFGRRLAIEMLWPVLTAKTTVWAS